MISQVIGYMIILFETFPHLFSSLNQVKEELAHQKILQIQIVSYCDSHSCMLLRLGQLPDILLNFLDTFKTPYIHIYQILDVSAFIF